MKTWEPLTDAIGLYRTETYPLQEDALRLAEFARIRKTDRVLDCGTGNGVLSIYAEALHGGKYAGIDVDEAALALAKESAARNGQSIPFLPLDVSDAPRALGHGSFDVILMNPPYFTAGALGARALSRHADGDLLDRWFHAAFLLLNNGGTLTLCYPAGQLAALFGSLERNRFAPKRVHLLFSGDVARLALTEAKKDGGTGLILTKS